jgi:uncharacterized membrane protein YphA (DoxX/SURF4 family)
MWHAVVPWVGTHVLRLTGDFTEVANGSGDQLYDYVLILCIAVTAVVITAIWSLLDRKRTNYARMYQWLRFFMRIVATVAMIAYGCNKLWHAQFPAPKLIRFIEPYGQTQPADLMWTFMGMSRVYSVFGGIGEMLGGLLLIVPQLTTLGAMVTAAVMTNVLMLNLAYDVPRKIYCFHLIAICVILMLPDLRRLFDFFALNRKTQLSKPVALFKDPFLSRGVLLFYIAIAFWAMWDQGTYSRNIANSASAQLPVPLRGIWEVKNFAVDGVERPPLLTDGDRWRRVVLDDPYEFDIQPIDGPVHRYLLVPDLQKKILTLAKPGALQQQYTLSFENPDANSLVLVGNLSDHQVSAKLTRMDLDDPVNFALTNRGFHWVTQYMHWINQLENWH